MPLNSKDKRARDIQSNIREILMHDWDPIGVKEIVGAEDEYDGYIGQVYRVLSSGGSEDDITDMLKNIVTENMGLESEREALRPVARKLRALDIELGKEK